MFAEPNGVAIFFYAFSVSFLRYNNSNETKIRNSSSLCSRSLDDVVIDDQKEAATSPFAPFNLRGGRYHVAPRLVRRRFRRLQSSPYPSLSFPAASHFSRMLLRTRSASLLRDERPVVDASMRVGPAYAQGRRKVAKCCSVVPCCGLVDVEVKSSLVPSSAHRSQGKRRDVPIFSSRGRCPRHRSTRSSTDEDTSGWCSGDDVTERLTRKPIPCAPLAVRGCFAVVKQSEDPRLDFLRSMAEMVVEKQIVSSKGLEQLLQCFLSLNSREHHAAILAAFEDIWQALFPAVPVRNCRQRSLQLAY